MNPNYLNNNQIPMKRPGNLNNLPYSAPPSIQSFQTVAQYNVSQTINVVSTTIVVPPPPIDPRLRFHRGKFWGFTITFIIIQIIMIISLVACQSVTYQYDSLGDKQPINRSCSGLRAYLIINSIFGGLFLLLNLIFYWLEPVQWEFQTCRMESEIFFFVRRDAFNECCYFWLFVFCSIFVTISFITAIIMFTIFVCQRKRRQVETQPETVQGLESREKV